MMIACVNSNSFGANFYGFATAWLLPMVDRGAMENKSLNVSIAVYATQSIHLCPLQYLYCLDYEC